MGRPLGHKVSNETRAKMSASRKLRITSEETKAKMSATQSIRGSYKKLYIDLLSEHEELKKNHEELKKSEKEINE